MTGPSASATATTPTSMYNIGLICVASASMLSGLSAALTQRALSGTIQRNTMVLSAEMAVYGIVFLLINLYFNNDIKGDSLLSNWDMATLIPVVAQVSIFCFLHGGCVAAIQHVFFDQCLVYICAEVLVAWSCVHCAFLCILWCSYCFWLCAPLVLRAVHVVPSITHTNVGVYIMHTYVWYQTHICRRWEAWWWGS